MSYYGVGVRTRQQYRNAYEWARVGTEAAQEATKRLKRLFPNKMAPIKKSMQTTQNKSNNQLGVGKTYRFVKMNDFGRWHKLGPVKNTYNETRTGFLNNIGGIQGVADILAYGTAQQICNNTSNPTITESTFAYIQNDPNQDATGTTGMTINNTKSNWQLFWKSIVMNFEFTNCDPIATVLDIYFLTPKVNTDIQPVVQWENSALISGQGASATNFPVAPSTDGTLGSINVETPYSKPQQHKTFNEAYKTLEHVQLHLAPSGCEFLCVKIAVNKVLDYSTIFPLVGKTQNVKNHTIRVMVVSRGATVFDSQVNKGNYSSAQTAWTVSTKLTFQDFEPGPQGIQTSLGVNRHSAGSAIANQKFSNVSGVVATQTDIV